MISAIEYVEFVNETYNEVETTHPSSEENPKGEDSKPRLGNKENAPLLIVCPSCGHKFSATQSIVVAKEIKEGELVVHG